MIKRTLRLLGLPLLLLCWTILILYPLLYVCALIHGYIFKNNRHYWLYVEIFRPSINTPGPLFLTHKGSEPMPEGYKLWHCGPLPTSYLSIDPLLNLWHWYWTDKPIIGKRVVPPSALENPLAKPTTF